MSMGIIYSDDKNTKIKSMVEKQVNSYILDEDVDVGKFESSACYDDSGNVVYELKVTVQRERDNGLEDR